MVQCAWTQPPLESTRCMLRSLPLRSMAAIHKSRWHDVVWKPGTCSENAKYISIQNEIYVAYQTVSCAILTGNKNSISSIGSERQNCWLRRAVPMRCWPAVLPPSRVLMLAFKLYAVVAQCRSLTLFVLMFAVVGCLAEGADLRGG